MWKEKAAEFAPQLGAYAEALRMAGKRVTGSWVSFAGGGRRGAGGVRGHPDRNAAPRAHSSKCQALPNNVRP